MNPEGVVDDTTMLRGTDGATPEVENETDGLSGLCRPVIEEYATTMTVNSVLESQPEEDDLDLITSTNREEWRGGLGEGCVRRGGGESDFERGDRIGLII